MTVSIYQLRVDGKTAVVTGAGGRGNSIGRAYALGLAMRARGGGRIVNQVSGGAFPAVSLYGVSKLALAGLTTTLAKQLGRPGKHLA
jgi:NAD(P)-dependent dehydrogenase (short-subunit alcohol dehydrogenase family)